MRRGDAVHEFAWPGYVSGKTAAAGATAARPALLLRYTDARTQERERAHFGAGGARPAQGHAAARSAPPAVRDRCENAKALSDAFYIGGPTARGQCDTEYPDYVFLT